MQYLNTVAEFCALPRAARGATVRLCLLIPIMFVVVWLDKYHGSAVPAAVFGYLVGALTSYGTMRVMLKQTEAGRRALIERGG